MAIPKKTNTYRPPQPAKEEHRLNDNIKVPEVRIIGDNIENGVYSLKRALEIALEMGLDLVEIAPEAKPPVCRIIDYGKFLYEKKRKEKELKAKAKASVLKEIQLSPNTDDHDLEFKARHAERFLVEEGAKVKVTLTFKGRTIAFKSRGEALMLRFIQLLEECGVPEQMPKLEGKRMFVFLNPKKKKA